MLKRALLYITFTLGMVLINQAQSFKWIKQIGDKSGETSPICKVLPEGQTIIAWRYSFTTQIDSFKATAKGYSNPYILSFLSKEGKAKWIWKPDSCYSTFTISSINYSKSIGKIYIIGNFNKGADINNQSFRGNTNGFIIKLDTNGTFEKIYTLSLDTSGLIFEGFEVSNNNDIVLGVFYDQNKSFPSSNLKIPSINFSINKTGNFVLKLDKDLNPIMASKPMYGTKFGKILISKNSNNILSTCIYRDTCIINGKSYFNGKNIFSAYITYLDSNLNFKKVSKIYTTVSTDNSITALRTLGNGDLIIGGWFRDSISIIPQQHVGYTMPLYACLDSNGKLKWAKLPQFKNGDWHNSYIYDLDVEDGYILGGGRIIGNTVFDDFNLPDSLGLFWFFKTDTRGNILWMRRVAFSKKYTTQNLTSISYNRNKEVILAGYILDTVKLNNQKFFTNGNFDILLMKIYDIEIYRGFVKSGPYCAGDTIKIPYTKDGDFNTGNEFIAQLSDADGNFTGKERELGRIKSTTAGTIKGLLPLFEVESSPHYRIRIISTNPVVQSYYKYDTLRLLIYSKDKANAGPPETICIGDSIRLKTYGGTKWTWSPKFNMTDSTLKKPIVWPAQTTTYRIIIADSSGCGKPDTAYKIIRVRKPLKANITFKDTAVCDTSVFNIPAWFEGGDSIDYSWQWFKVSISKKIWKPLIMGKLKLNDTLAHIPKVTTYTNDTLAIVLKDKCTNKNDTAFMILRLLKPSVIINKYTDTLMCKGKVVNYKAQMWFAQPYQWQWRDMTSNKILSTTESLSLTASNTMKILLEVNNGCTSDTNAFNFNVNPPLKANLFTDKGNLNDTVLCFGQSLKILTKGNGGAGSGYVYSWIFEGKQVSSSDSFLLKTKDYFTNKNSTFSLALTLNDNCTIVADTITKIISVNEIPIANFSYGIACTQSNTGFIFTGSKPKFPITTDFKWNFNNEAISSIENPSHKFAAAGTSTLTLTLVSSNGCTDTLRKQIVIQPKSKAAFKADNVCDGDSVIFENTSQNATGYTWRFGDGAISNMQNAKHKYQIATSTTFNVSLLALVFNGCADSIINPVTVYENPSSDFTYIQTGNTFDLNAKKVGLTTYTWIFGTTDSITKTIATHTHIASSKDQSKICLAVTDLQGCTSKTCKTATIEVSKTEKSSEFKIYPNPNAGSFTIEIVNLEEGALIEVFDLVGKKIKEAEMLKNIIRVYLDVESGIYMMRVKSGNKVWNEKVSIITF